MDQSNTARSEFQAGRLQQAIQTALADVKSQPTNIESRGFLAELLCFDRQWEKADKQMDAIGHQDPEAIVGLSLIRQLIRAEVSRAECFQQGRPPELLADPTPSLQKSLEALAAVRDDDATTAAELVEEAERLRPAVSGAAD
ncbi:MAG: SciE type virulence protein, partial [Planctomycetota bacterium]